MIYSSILSKTLFEYFCQIYGYLLFIRYLQQKYELLLARNSPNDFKKAQQNQWKSFWLVGLNDLRKYCCNIVVLIKSFTEFLAKSTIHISIVGI